MSSRRRPPVKIVMCPSCGAPNTRGIYACQACGTPLAARIPAPSVAISGPVRPNPSRLTYADQLRAVGERPRHKKRNENWLMDWKIAAPLLLLAGLFGLRGDHNPLSSLLHLGRRR